MAYGLKYELHCTSKLNNFYKLKLLFEGYEGSEIDRNVPVSPFHLRKDRADIICGTSLEFAICEEVDFELLEFYTNNWKYIKAELYKSTTLIWAGYVAPQQYQAAYIPASRKPAIWFTATDGLGLLKNEDFTLTGDQSQLAIIMHCMDKIGLNLGYSIAIDLFHGEHNETYSPLAQTYEDASIYEDYNCYEVLEKMLVKYDAEITQSCGRWRIVSKCDKKAIPKLYTCMGAYESAGSAPTVLDLGYPGTGIEVSPVGTLQMGLQAGGNRVKITHNFGRKDSLLDNYDFSKYSDGSFEDWIKEGTFDVYQRADDTRKYAFLSGYTTSPYEWLLQSIPIKRQHGENFVFKIDFALIGKHVEGTLITPVDMTMRLSVVLIDGEDFYYLTETGWTTNNQNIFITCKSSIATPVWNTLQVTTENIPCDGNLMVKLFRCYSSGPPEGTFHDGIAYSAGLAYFINMGEKYPGKIEVTASFDNSAELKKLEDIEIKAADAPINDGRYNFINAGQLYKNITKLSDGTLT